MHSKPWVNITENRHIFSSLCLIPTKRVYRNPKHNGLNTQLGKAVLKLNYFSSKRLLNPMINWAGQLFIAVHLHS